jgi:2-polyprenyl-3-methyl-5-hydroxy-6-metoxy-1,4-benzoquinol methylase
MKSINLLDLVANFFNISTEEALKKIKESEENTNRDWHNKKSVLDFYKTTENYAFGLIPFNSPSRINELIYPIRGIKDKDILDFGGGIGLIGMIFSRTNKVYYYDIGKVTSKFAKFISKKLKCPITILTEEEMKNRKYNVIIIADVLEHLENPIKTIKMLTNLLRKKGILLSTGLNFRTDPVKYPMHLQKNINNRPKYSKYIIANYHTLFLHSTPNETIYAHVKK